MAAHTRSLLLLRSRGAVVVHCSVVDKGRKAWLGGKSSPSPSQLLDGAPPARCSRELRPHLPLMPDPPVIYLEEWIGWKIHIIAIWRVPKNNFFSHQPCTYPPSSPLGPLRFCTGKKIQTRGCAHPPSPAAAEQRSRHHPPLCRREGEEAVAGREVVAIAVPPTRWSTARALLERASPSRAHVEAKNSSRARA